MDNDRRKIELMNSLLFSFPGTPIIYYGDEIGMGDNIYLGDRNGVRTPMQWSPDRNGGFSRADPARLYAPPIMDPVYGYEAVNVEAQSRSLSSLLSVTRRLISVRKSTLAFGRGTMIFIRPTNRAVLAYVRQYRDEVILCVANLSRSAQATELDLSSWKERIPLEMLGRTRFPAIGERPYMVTLAPYGFYWFQLQERDKSEPPPQRAVPEFETLVVPLNSTWVSLARTRGVFERDVLPGFLARSRWYPERNPTDIQPTLTSAVPFCTIGDNRPWVAFFDATQHGVTSRHVLPMQIEWVRFDRERYNPQALAAVRQGAREGTLLDVAGDPIFIGLFLRNLRQRETVDENGLRLEFAPTAKFADRPIRQPKRVHVIEAEARNTVSLVDHDYVVKIYRKLETGIHPELEVGRYLTEVAGFANTPALLGGGELVEGDARSAIGVIHAYVENQGDGWTVTTGYLDRYVDEQRIRANGEYGQAGQLPPYQRLMSQTGRRLAELHLALAAHPELPDFAPEPTWPEDVACWIAEATARADRIFDALRQRRDDLRDGDQTVVDQLLSYRTTLQDRLAAMPADIGGLKIRNHGDFRLGETLIVKDDIFIIDVEGDPRQALTERRRKMPAARDVASLIRSIDYSAAAALERARRAGIDDRPRFAPALSDWRAGARAAFLAGYDEAMTDKRLWPADPRARNELLDFFLLEKAVTEIEYELSRRPERLRLPLSTTLLILSESADEAS